MKKLRKEYKLDVCNHIVLKYGTVNRDNPQVIYISGKCWVCPLHQMNYPKVVSNIEKEMRKNIKNIMTDGVNFDKKFILDFDVNSERLSPSHKMFLSFDFYLRQNEKNKKELASLQPLLRGKVSTISNNLVYSFRENDFQIEKRK